MPNIPAIRRAAVRCILLSSLLTLPLCTHCLFSHSAQDTAWRRTNQGWQHVEVWNVHRPQYNPPRAALALHPLVVASFEVCLAAGSLLAFESR
jgi:hypothetical protein